LPLPFPLKPNLIHSIDRLEKIIQSQARLIEMHILQGQRPMGHEMHHGGSISYSSPSEPSAIHGPSPRTAVYFNDPSSSVTLPSRRPDTSIASPSDTSVKNLVHNGLQNGNAASAMGSLPPAQNAHNGDYTVSESRCIYIYIYIYITQHTQKCIYVHRRE
jgi:hypothetical protein